MLERSNRHRTAKSAVELQLVRQGAHNEIIEWSFPCVMRATYALKRNYV